MPGDPNEQYGTRDLFRRADGSYYPEAHPGAGPADRDDVRLTPEDLEDKAAGVRDDLENELARIQGGFRDVEAVDGPTGAVLAVFDLDGLGGGSMLRAYLPAQAERAHEHARNVKGVLCELPIVADYRNG